MHAETIDERRKKKNGFTSDKVRDAPPNEKPPDFSIRRLLEDRPQRGSVVMEPATNHRRAKNQNTKDSRIGGRLGNGGSDRQDTSRFVERE